MILLGWICRLLPLLPQPCSCSEQQGVAALWWTWRTLHRAGNWCLPPEPDLENVSYGRQNSFQSPTVRMTKYGSSSVLSPHCFYPGELSSPGKAHGEDDPAHSFSTFPSCCQGREIRSLCHQSGMWDRGHQEASGQILGFQLHADPWLASRTLSLAIIIVDKAATLSIEFNDF